MRVPDGLNLHAPGERPKPADGVTPCLSCGADIGPGRTRRKSGSQRMPATYDIPVKSPPPGTIDLLAAPTPDET